jgi:uncharacterized membrane-anchored protein
MKLARTSMELLVIQLALVSLIAAKYLYQRWTCPTVWTRAAAYDPEMLMRGRYLSLQLTVDGCQSTLPSAAQAVFLRDKNGAAGGTTYSINPSRSVEFPAKLKVDGNKLVAIRNPDDDNRPSGIMVSAMPGASCENMRIDAPVDFFIAEHAADPSRLRPGQELWIEVTVPPKGPPRPLQLALKENGAWKPLAFE